VAAAAKSNTRINISYSRSVIKGTSGPNFKRNPDILEITDEQNKVKHSSAA